MKIVAIPLAMIFAALTQFQSTLILGCLAFVVVLLGIGMINSLRRLSDLEKVVYASRDKTRKVLKDIGGESTNGVI